MSKCSYINSIHRKKTCLIQIYIVSLQRVFHGIRFILRLVKIAYRDGMQFLDFAEYPFGKVFFI